MDKGGVVDWTNDQILAMAPDTGVAKDAQKLANSSKWKSSLAHNDRAAWGECQGSGKDPYKVQIDLQTPAFKCSCPSRKIPCKHAIGLFLLLADQPKLFSNAEPPTWVTTWLSGRDARATKVTSDKPIDEAAQAKRAAKREAKVNAGVQELDLWLRDVIRGGLADLQSQSYKFWDAPAARMTDAQASGLARQLRDMAGIPVSGAGWQERLLERLGLLHLIVEAYGRLDTLAPELQADVRTIIGWSQKQEELLTQTGEWDCWRVVARRMEEEENLRTQRTWLWSANTRKSALVLDFAFGTNPLDTSLPPNLSLEAEMVFFPSAYPLRALVKSRRTTSPTSAELPGYDTLAEATAAYTAALACQPWLGGLNFPLLLKNIVPMQAENRWYARDAENRVMPFARSFDKVWHLLAFCGGYPITVFGEWNGETLLPLSAWAHDQFIHL